MTVISLGLGQIRALEVAGNQIVFDDWGRGWRGFTGAAPGTYTHAPGSGTIVPDGGDGSAAWLLTAASKGYASVPFPDIEFANGTTNGMDVTTFGWRLNNNIDNQPLITTVALPDDLDPDGDVTVQVRIRLTGSTDTTVTPVLVARFDGGADVAPVAETTLTPQFQTVEFTVPAEDVPTSAGSLWLELDCDSNLNTDHGVIASVGLRYQQTLPGA